jgi:hypothetical protein
VPPAPGSAEAARPRRPGATLLALLLVHLPYLHATWIHLSGRDLSVAELMLYPLLIGGAGIALIAVLVRFLFRERLADLNRRPGTVPRDVVAGAIVCVASFAVMIAHSLILAPFLPQPGAPPQAVATLFTALRESPFLRALWLGPVVWIGVAGFEELSRVFLLDRLWKLWPSPGARAATVVLSAVVWGFVHIYQGVSNVVGVSLLGLLLGAVYLRFGRVWPLIISHALFDSVQIVAAVAGTGANA